ncbi:MAG: WG repeat-containing protein [Nevskiales bacterium]
MRTPALLLLSCTLAACLCGEAPSAWVTFEGENGLMGYQSRRGETLIPPQFIHADPFGADGLASVRREQGWTWIDRHGKPLVEQALEFDIAPDPFAEGLARFLEREKVGFFDRRGRIVIPARYDFAYPMQQGFAVFCFNCKREYHGEHYRMAGGRWGLVKRDGKEVVAPIYDEILPAGDSGYSALRSGRRLRLNARGEETRS